MEVNNYFKTSNEKDRAEKVNEALIYIIQQVNK